MVCLLATSDGFKEDCPGARTLQLQTHTHKHASRWYRWDQRKKPYADGVNFVWTNGDHRRSVVCWREVTASPRGCQVTDLRGSETALWKEGIRSGLLWCLVSLAPRTQSYQCGHGSVHRSRATLHVRSGIRVTC